MPDPMDTTELHPIYRISGLGRSIELKYPTHRFVVGVSVLFGVAGTLLGLSNSLPVGEAISSGLNLSLTAFLAWALLRELAPDSEQSAYVAGGLSALTWLAFGVQNIPVLLVSLLAARMVSRSPGRAMSGADTILVIGGLAFAPEPHRWAMGFIIGAAMAMDGAFSAPADQRRRPEHLPLGLIAMVVITWFGRPVWQPPESPWWIVLAAILVAGMLAIALQPPADSVGDVDGQTLSTQRVRAGAALGVGVFALSGWTSGDPWSSLAAGWVCVVALLMAPLLGRR